jgi:hypothetical protein
MLPAQEEFRRELMKLSHGWGIQANGLSTRLGPRLTALCSVQQNDLDPVIRQKIRRTLHRLATGTPPDLRLAMDIALAIAPQAQHAHLKERTDVVAELQYISVREARRRIDKAFRWIAQVAAQMSLVTAPDDPEKGWHFRRLDAALRLDTKTPVLRERRTIVATCNGLRSIGVRFSLPRDLDDQVIDHHVHVDSVTDVDLASTERLEYAHFRYLLTLPRALFEGEEHAYEMIFRVPDHHSMKPYYAYRPLVRCEFFKLDIHFDPQRLPAAVWLIDHLTWVPDDEHPAARLYLDGNANLALEFPNPEQGFLYGIRWRH